MHFATAIGCPAVMAQSPVTAFEAEDDCSWVLITSNGFVIQDASVPATPPDNKLET